MTELPKDIEKYGDALAKAWEQYLKIIDLLIVLCGATALILVNILKDTQTQKLHSQLGVWTLATFGMTLLFITLWRFAAQHFYEYETIGSPTLSRRYFDFNGIDEPFTRAFLPQKRLRSFYRTIYPLVAHGSGVLLASTWLLLVAVAVG